MKKKKIAIYPGSFDPMTNGHLDILKRTKKTKLFDKIVCAIGINDEKDPVFTLDERLDMLYHTVPKGIEVDSFDGLLVDYAKKKKARYVIRGLRFTTDYEYEFTINLANKKLDPDLETFFLMSEQDLLHVQGRIVRDISRYGIGYVGSLNLVPPYVLQRLKEKFQK